MKSPANPRYSYGYGSINQQLAYVCLLPYMMGDMWNNPENSSQKEVIYLEDDTGMCECYKKRELKPLEIADMVAFELEKYAKTVD